MQAARENDACEIIDARVQSGCRQTGGADRGREWAGRRRARRRARGLMGALTRESQGTARSVGAPTPTFRDDCTRESNWSDGRVPVLRLGEDDGPRVSAQRAERGGRNRGICEGGRGREADGSRRVHGAEKEQRSLQWGPARPAVSGQVNGRVRELRWSRTYNRRGGRPREPAHVPSLLCPGVAVSQYCHWRGLSPAKPHQLRAQSSRRDVRTSSIPFPPSGALPASPPVPVFDNMRISSFDPNARTRPDGSDPMTTPQPRTRAEKLVRAPSAPTGT